MAVRVRADQEHLVEPVATSLAEAYAHGSVAWPRLKHRGFGRFAVEAVAAEIRRRGGIRMFTTYEPGEPGPGPFYARLGFRPTGETSSGQTVAALALG